MPAAFPLSLRTIIRSGKSRSQPAAFSMSEPRRGYAYAQAIGTDTPVFWDVTFKFTQPEAALFQLWFTQTIQRGLLEFTLPIKTEFGLQTHTCRFLPDGLLPVQEDGEIWVYSAKIMARAQIIPADAITQYGAAFNGPIPNQSSYVGGTYSASLAGYWSGGAGPFTYALVSGSLPDGIALDSATGVMSGATTVEGATVKTGLVVRRFGAYGLHTDSNAFTFTAAATSSPPDPSFASNSLLLHLDGADDSKIFIDSGPLALPVSWAGGVHIDLDHSWSNGASAYFDGIGDFLSVPYNAALDLASSQFTVECWMRMQSTTTGIRTLFEFRGSSASYLSSWSIDLDYTNRTLNVYNGPTNTTVLSTPNGSIPLETWQHLAVCRDGTTLRLFVSGVLLASGSFSPPATHSSGIRIGNRHDTNAGLRGNLDEVRIKKGVALYTSTFTPPSLPFPNY